MLPLTHRCFQYSFCSIIPWCGPGGLSVSVRLSAKVLFSFYFKKWCHFLHWWRVAIDDTVSELLCPSHKMYTVYSSASWRNPLFGLPGGKQLTVKAICLQKRLLMCKVDSPSVSHCVAYEVLNWFARLPWQHECSQYFLVRTVPRILLSSPSFYFYLSCHVTMFFFFLFQFLSFLNWDFSHLVPD